MKPVVRKKHLGGEILYQSVNPAKKNGVIVHSVGETLNERLHRITHKAGIVLFMKGNPTEPKCKFSRATMELLKSVQGDLLECGDFG